MHLQKPPTLLETMLISYLSLASTVLAIFLQPPDCDPSKDCGSWVVYPYFISFVVLVSIIMLQLFTAVIIESFEAQEEQDVSAHKGGSAPPVSQLFHNFTIAALVY
jgi:hypothetical protein